MTSDHVRMDKEQIDFNLFRNWNYNLPDIALSVNQCEPFVFLRDEAVTAQCLVLNKKFYGDITHFAYTSMDDATAMLSHLHDHYKQTGLKYVEIGCGNANLELYTLFQRVGYRVVGVVANHFVGDQKTVVVENSIPNLDLIRFRLRLDEKGFTTIGSNASGVKDYD